MLTAMVAAIVGFSTRWPRVVVAAAALLTVICGVYAAANFRITTDTEKLLPDDLPWRQSQAAYVSVFPQNQIVVVVEAPTPEMVELAAARLEARLREQQDVLGAVRRPDGGAFFERNGLLFMPTGEVADTARKFREAQPVLGLLASDPSLRGVTQTLMVGVDAVQNHKAPVTALLPPMNMLSATLEDVFAGRFATMSWRALLMGQPAVDGGAGEAGSPARAFLTVDPKLDYNELQPGRAATDAIRQAVQAENLPGEFGARVRLTGRVPISDEQFSALSDNGPLHLGGTVLAVLVILWLALRSGRIIAAGFATLVVGFVVTAAAGLMLVGAFNVISIAFAVLFIGLGADFAIQFAVRYRAERHARNDVRAALRGAATKAGGPLGLAAASTAVGFFCFLPTAYRGVAELGVIAGVGMLVAFLTTITLMPALIVLGKPHGEPHPMRSAALAPMDRFLARHRIAVVVGTIAVVLAGTPLLFRMHFDFDPTHLQDQNGEAVKTYRQLSAAPEMGVNAVNLIAPSVDAIAAEARRFAVLPEVGQIRSVSDLVPADQEPKLVALQGAAATLRPVLDTGARPPPSDAETVATLRAAAAELQRASALQNGPAAAAATRLRRLLAQLADSDPAMRGKAQNALVVPLKRDLDRLRNMLRPEAVTLKSLPPELAGEWIAPDGRARLQIQPKGDPNDTETLRRFAHAVLTIAPDAVGAPVGLVQSARVVIRAFVEAGIFAVLAIGVILWLALRRIGDVLLTLVPLLVAGAVTMEIMVLLGEPLNFANVIALPLLLGVGVAFKIYYIMAWRTGRTDLLQSTLTRAVLFSAATTATAFGSLWLSSEPGMSSMGKLMALALVCTMGAAVLFQPALMGPPRTKRAPVLDEEEDFHEAPRRRTVPEREREPA